MAVYVNITFRIHDINMYIATSPKCSIYTAVFNTQSAFRK